MTETLPHPGRPFALGNPVPWIILGLWAAMAFTFVKGGAFVQAEGLPALRLMPAVALPVALFWLAFAAMPVVRTWVASLDLAVVVGAQSWRVIGLAFLMLWALGLLPTVFALVAGLGDVAVGLTAMLATVAVSRRQPGWQRRARAVTIAGLADFTIVFTLAMLSGPGSVLLRPGDPSLAVMQIIPMGLIPAFGVPLFIILHSIAWIRLRADVTPISR